MVEQQIAETVNNQVLEVLATDEWLKSIEEKIVKYSQDRILGKFANSSAVPELVDAIKQSVAEMFDRGLIPNIENFVDKTTIRQAVDQAVEQNILSAIELLGQDPAWLQKIEHMINQAVVQRTMAGLKSIDFTPMVKQCVDENMLKFRQDILTKFSSTGIDDRASSCQLTVMDDCIVIEKQLTAKNIEAVESLTTNDLSVRGSINVNNRSWQTLADTVAKKTLEQISQQWTNDLIDRISTQIKLNGISFDQVKIGDTLLIQGNQLSSSITESKMQTLGQLKELTVKGAAYINNNTVNVLNRRLGINTPEPDMALSVWDEEVSISIGKYKNKQGWIGTSRDQGLSIGVNKSAQIEIDSDGLTTVKKLRIGLHKISHDVRVPGWSGTRGDLVFNTNPGADRVFAWVCLGGHKWETLKSA